MSTSDEHTLYMLISPIKDKPFPSDILESEENSDKGCPRLHPGTPGLVGLQLSACYRFPCSLSFPDSQRNPLLEDALERDGLCHLLGMMVSRDAKVKVIHSPGVPDVL